MKAISRQIICHIKLAEFMFMFVNFEFCGQSRTPSSVMIDFSNSSLRLYLQYVLIDDHCDNSATNAQNHTDFLKITMIDIISFCILKQMECESKNSKVHWSTHHVNYHIKILVKLCVYSFQNRVIAWMLNYHTLISRCRNCIFVRTLILYICFSERSKLYVTKF